MPDKAEENSAPPVELEPTTSCLHGQGHTTTCAKGEPEVVGRGSGSYNYILWKSTAHAPKQARTD